MQDEEITQLLVAWQEGNETARNKLLSEVETELRQIANRYLRSERQNHTL
jgi:hypothetical protein